MQHNYNNMKFIIYINKEEQGCLSLEAGQWMTLAADQVGKGSCWKYTILKRGASTEVVVVLLCVNSTFALCGFFHMHISHFVISKGVCVWERVVTIQCDQSDSWGKARMHGSREGVSVLTRRWRWVWEKAFKLQPEMWIVDRSQPRQGQWGRLPDRRASCAKA